MGLHLCETEFELDTENKRSFNLWHSCGPELGQKDYMYGANSLSPICLCIHIIHLVWFNVLMKNNVEYLGSVGPSPLQKVPSKYYRLYSYSLSLFKKSCKITTN
jgi:hypothetical protein